MTELALVICWHLLLLYSFGAKQLHSQIKSNHNVRNL